MQEKIFIENKQGEKLAGIFHKNNNKKQVVIICHGWPGSKDNWFTTEISKALDNININLFRFDFSGHGESEGKFEDAVITKEQQDLDCVVDHFKDKDYEISLIGHSMGGLNIILHASKNKKIKFVIAVSTVIETKDKVKKFKPEQQELINNGKNTYYKEEKYDKKYPIYPKFFQDIEKFNPVKDIKNIDCPKLFIVGSKDTMVEETNIAYIEANEPKALKVIEGADHNFTNPELLKKMINYTKEWIKKHID